MNNIGKPHRKTCNKNVKCCAGEFVGNAAPGVPLIFDSVIMRNAEGCIAW